jgi:WD40 repeat protein
MGIHPCQNRHLSLLLLQGPQKAITAAAISTTTTVSETFFVGSADGRVLSYDSTGTASPLAGQGHTNLVSGLASTPNGKVFSTGYDDRVREVEGSQFTYISAFLLITGKKLNNIKINYITLGHPYFPRPLSRKLWRQQRITPFSWSWSTRSRQFGIIRRSPIFGRGEVPPAPPPSLPQAPWSRSVLV